MIKKILFAPLLLLAACVAKPPHIEVTVQNHGKTLKISGMDKEIIKKLADKTSALQTLMPVYRTTATATDDDGFEYEQPGNYQTSAQDIYFIPDTPLVQGKQYLLRYYKFDKGGSLWELMSAKNKPGTHPYSEIAFKP